MEMRPANDAMPEWETAHREIVRLAAVTAEHEHALGRALLRALRAQVWRPMGLGSFVEYAERVLGLTPRQLEERLRVARALEVLPLTSTALAGGAVHFSAVRELTRVVTPETEADWLAATANKTVIEIQKLCGQHRPGDAPTDPPDDSARRHRVVLELSAEAYALYRDAQARLRAQTPLTEEEGLVLMARAVLGGPVDEGRSPYQIHVTVCERCGRATQDGRGEAITIDPTAVEVANCDAQRIDDTGRATQDIPPATRRLAVRRQHGRCAVPGCRHVLFTDVHHLTLRSEGGGHDPDNLILLCGVHHAAIHRGTLILDGSWATGLNFRHADGTSYALPLNPGAAEVLADVQSALVNLGFRQSEARVMVDAVRPHVRASAAHDFADVFRRALAARPPRPLSA